MKARGVKPRAILAGGLAALAAGAGAALALAGTGDIEWQGTTTDVPDDAVRTLTVACGTGRAIGGGGGFGGSIDHTPELASSAPIDGDDGDKAPDDGWLAAGINEPAGGSRGVRVDVLCTPRGELTYRSDRLPLPGRKRPTATKVSCPAGTSVTGGGANVKEPTPWTEIAVSSPYDDGDAANEPDDGWRAVLTNFGGSDTRMGVFAICADQGRYTYVQGQSGVLNPPSQGSVTTQDCPGAQAAVGGGGSVNKPRHFTELIGSEPTGGGPSGPFDAWESTLNNDGLDPNDGRVLTAWVICRG